MSALIAVVGASGVGKTALVRALAHTGKFITAFEQHAERPFQALFKADKRYALANQMDYMLLRAEQEKDLRTAPLIGLTDGGLDLDFHGFTRLFLSRGLLTQPEHDLCRRLYLRLREHLPPPELILHLTADEATVTQRLAGRDRINIASAEDTSLFNEYLHEWLNTLPPEKIITLDVTHESLDYLNAVQQVLGAVDPLYESPS